MVQTSPEQSLTLRERFLGPQSDEGSVKKAVAVALGAAAVSVSASGLGLAVSMGGYAREHTLTKSTTTVEGGHGEVTYVGSLPLPKTSYGLIKSNVEGVKASRDNKLFGKYSYGNYATVILTKGEYTTEIGNPPLILDFAPGKNGKKVSIAFPLDQLEATVYPTDPLNGIHLQNDNGIWMAARGNAENIINAIPKLGAHDVNDVYDRLRGTVEFDALQITAEKCVPAGWEYLQPIYFKDVIDYTVAQINKQHPEASLTAQDAEIAPSGAVMFTSQYQKQFDEFKTKNEANGDHFVVSNPANVSCEVNSNVTKQTSSAVQETK